MTGSLRWIARNVGDLATLSYSLAPYTGMPVANLQKPRRARVFRYSTSAGSPNGQTIMGTFNGDAYTVSAVGLDRTNFSSAATVRFRSYATSDWTGATNLDGGTVSGYNASALGPYTWGTLATGVDVKDGYLGFKYWMQWLTSYGGGVSCKSFRIDILDEANPDLYIEASRLVLGDFMELQRNSEFNLEFGWEEETEQVGTDGGSIISYAKLPRRVIEGTVPAIEAVERTLIADMTRYAGMRKAVTVSLQPNEGASLDRDFTILQAKFQIMPKLKWILPSHHAFPFKVREA